MSLILRTQCIVLHLKVKMLEWYIPGRQLTNKGLKALH